MSEEKDAAAPGSGGRREFLWVDSILERGLRVLCQFELRFGYFDLGFGLGNASLIAAIFDRVIIILRFFDSLLRVSDRGLRLSLIQFGCRL